MDYIKVIKQKYEYLNNDEIKYYIGMAKSLLISRLYPSDMSVSYETYEIPPRFDWWIIKCVTEYIQRDGMSNLVAYKENGVSYTWDNSGISNSLLAEIPRICGVVK